MALLYQHRPPPQVRATLGVYFVLGAAMSLIGLAVSGDVHARDLGVAAVLLPVLVAGFGTSLVLRAHVDPGHVRAAMLAVCGISSAALIVRSLAG